jgi:hypothetical protein
LAFGAAAYFFGFGGGGFGAANAGAGEPKSTTFDKVLIAFSKIGST